MKKIKKVLVIVSLFLFAISIAACNSGSTTSRNTTETVPQEKVTLTIAGAWNDCRGIQEIGLDFTKQYPNCLVSYENIQNYENALPKRLSGDNQVDIFFVSSIQSGSKYLPYAVDLNNVEGLDLSGTYEGLIINSFYREDNERTSMLFSLPVGGEMRGLYVNKTLLRKLNLNVPKNQSELLAACEVIAEAGYIPFAGNPGDFSTNLLYPWIANEVANAENYEEVYNKIENKEEGCTDVFTEVFEFLYEIVTKRYYAYGTGQREQGIFNDSTSEDYVRHFLNIVSDGSGYKLADNIGRIAFMPQTLSLKELMEDFKKDYESTMEYEFIPAPVGENGGYVYLSPAHSIAANKNSPNLEWAIKFLNFMFQAKNNEKFAQYMNVIPNHKEAFTYLKNRYDVSLDRISQVGQATFSYEFYDTIRQPLIALSKGNNEVKYMINLNKDENNVTQYLVDSETEEEYLLTSDGKNRVSKEYVGDEDPLKPGLAFYTFDYYIGNLKKAFESTND